MQPDPARLVLTPSSVSPPPDLTEVRWRRRPVLAAAVRMFVLLAPLAASVVAGVLASRQFRPHTWTMLLLWLLWTAAVSITVLAVVDVLARRLLPLHRLLQLCLAFPDRAPSRLKLAVRAARNRRPEALLGRADAPPDAAAAAQQIVTLLGALAIHDRRTRGHSERVCAYTELLAGQLDLSQADRDRLLWVALIHDIGKLHVPPRLLNKPGAPTVSEWRLLQAHPERGAALSAPLREWLGPWADAVVQHHERHDGHGYPHGLAGDEMCLGARVIAVTDAFEVMTAPRPYRRPVDAQAARAELARHAGTQFDPEVVRQFLAVGLPELRKAMGLFAWLGQLPFIAGWPRLESALGSATGQAAATTAVASTAGLLIVGSAPGVMSAQAQGHPESRAVLGIGPHDGASAAVPVAARAHQRGTSRSRPLGGRGDSISGGASVTGTAAAPPDATASGSTATGATPAAVPVPAPAPTATAAQPSAARPSAGRSTPQPGTANQDASPSAPAGPTDDGTCTPRPRHGRGHHYAYGHRNNPKHACD